MRISNEEKEWILSTPYRTEDRHLDASREIEKSRIHKQGEFYRGRAGKSDSPRKNTPSEMLGKSREQGQLIECGRFLELWVPAEKFHVGTPSMGSPASREKRKEEQEESRKSIAKRVNHRARKCIRRLVNANDFRAMHTLTLAPPSERNDLRYKTVPYEKQRNYEYVRSLFREFLRRCRRAGISLTYLAVFELHDSPKTRPEKRGTWHIHLATPINGTMMYAIENLWRHGLTDFQDFRFDKRGRKREEEITNPGAYIAEYIGKEGAQFGGPALTNKRRYTTSRDVKKPIQQALSSVDLEGDFDLIAYKGKKYRNVFYSSIEIPGTNKLSITATYQEIEI